LLPEVLSYQDMLGAYVDPSTSTVRLVYCPRNRKRSRVRKDVLLKIGGSGSVGSSLAEAEAWAADVSQRCFPADYRRRFLVFVNPASGNGSAPQNWRQVEELWSALAGIECTVVTTESANDAQERVKSMDLESCDGIVVVSGDGLVHEVLNGLAARSDAKRALELIPVGHIPGGSGNGLAKSILSACGESFGVLDMAFLIAKGGRQPITLMKAQVGDGPLRTSFLSLAAATISDVDLGSESLRCLGGLRFTVWAVWRVIRPLKLRMRIVYWPVEAPGKPPAEAPPLSAELSGEPWKTIEDDVAIFWGMNVAWGSYDACPAPGAALHDGVWHLVVLRGRSITRSALLSFFLRLETGGQVDLPGVEVLRCRALRLEPLEEGGFLSLDGEQVPCVPVQVWPMACDGYVLGR